MAHRTGRQIRMPEALFAAIDLVAAREGVPASTWMRGAILDAVLRALPAPERSRLERELVAEAAR
jgi:hypothetical protein